MSVNKPGLPKLNLKSNTQASFKSALSSKLATTQRSSVSYGIFAQRSDRSKIYNPKAYLSDSTSATRHALLDNRVKVFNNNVASSCNHTSSTDNSNKYAAALMAMNMLSQTISPLINSKADAKGDVKTNAKSSAEGAIGELANAKNSAEIQKGLDKVEAEIKDYETQIAKAEDTIKEETKLKSENETKLKDTETQIGEEKQNIAKQESTITKLQSSIQSDKMRLDMLKSSLSGAGELTKMSLQSEISELEAKIKQEEDQLKKAQDSKAKSENNLKTNLEPAKEKLTKDIATCDKNIQDAEAEKNSASSKKDALDEANVKYTKKLSDAQNKESKELAKLHKEIVNYAKEFQETTDTDKKNKLAQKYAGKAKEYNEIVRNSTTSTYTEVSVDLNG